MSDCKGKVGVFFMLFKPSCRLFVMIMILRAMADIGIADGASYFAFLIFLAVTVHCIGVGQVLLYREISRERENADSPWSPSA